MSVLVLVAMILSQPSPEVSEKKIKELQKERVTNLRELEDQIVKQYDNGIAECSDALDIKMLLQKVELVLCHTIILG
jgi:hypothetical protein